MTRLIAPLPLVCALLLCLGDLLANSPQEEREFWNRPDPDWWKGPVRYSLSMREVTGYRSLQTAAERATFIARFWAARDPDLSTLWNEAEEIFWQRVGAADELFGEGMKPGWQTDRGWIYVTLGPPDEITNRSGFSAVTWLFRALPDPRAPANVCYAFVRDTAGDYRLANPETASALRLCGGRPVGTGFSDLPWLPLSKSPPFPRFKPGGPSHPAATSEKPSWYSGLGSDQAAILVQAFPPVLPRTKVTSQEVYGQLFLRHRLSFLRGGGGSTRVLITVGLPYDVLVKGGFPGLPLGLTGRLERVEAPGEAYGFGSQRASDSPNARQEVSDEIHQVFQISGEVAPGEYRLTLEARLGQQGGHTEMQMLVPDLSQENFSVGGPILADRVEVIETHSFPSDFDLGGFRVYAKLVPLYAPGDPLTFYFQTYDALVGIQNRPHLTFHYEIFRREHKTYQPAGQPVTLANSSSPNHAFSFPLQNWMPGDYLLVVTAEDGTRGKTGTGSVAFEVR